MIKWDKYGNDYLNEVIFRINFSNLLFLSINKEESVESFRKHIFEKFPQVLVKEIYEVNRELCSETKDFNEFGQNKSLIWNFSNKNNDKIVEISDFHLSLTYKKGAYAHFKGFLNDVTCC